jgi:hypothetical protein
MSLANDICSRYEYHRGLSWNYTTHNPEFYEAQQNFEQANIFLKKHYALKDSITATRLEKSTIELDISL